MMGDPRVDEWIKWGKAQKDPITGASLDEEFREAQKVSHFSSALYPEVANALGGSAFRNCTRLTKGMVSIHCG